MKLAIYAVGRLKTGPEKEMFDRYAALALPVASTLGLTVSPVREIAESRASNVSTRRTEESAHMMQAVSRGAFTIVLDENGRDIGSEELSNLIARKMRESTPEVAFMVGGPDGHDQTQFGHIDLKLRFGSMTWPHRLVRIMLAEQIYRATTVLSNHPYHRR